MRVKRGRFVAAGVLVAVAGAAMTGAGTSASGAAVTSVAAVPLVPGLGADQLVTDVSDTDPPQLLVSGGSGVYVVNSATNAVTTVFEAAPGGFASGAAISGDGGYVVYDYEPPGRVDPDPAGVFVKNLQTGVVSKVATSSDEVDPPIGNSFGSGISDDGRYVVFASTASGLVAGEGGTETDLDVFLRDTVDGTTVAVSDTGSTLSDCFPGGLSGNASVVVYHCLSPSGDSATSFVWNRATGARSMLPPQPDASYVQSSVSNNGTILSLTSVEVPFSGTSREQLLVRNGATGAVTIIPFVLKGNEFYANSEISDDGRYVLFEVATSDLASDSLPNEIYVYDTVTGARSWISQSLPEVSGFAFLGAGNRVYFTSIAELPGQPANPSDTFVARFRPYDQPPAASARSGFVPVPPQRVASVGPVGPTDVAYISLSQFVPEGATAVAVNVTLSGVTDRTYVSVCSAGTPRQSCLGTSVVNPYPGRDVANLSFPQVAADRVLQVFNNEGEVLVNVDLVGYFTTTASTTTAPVADFTPVTPARESETATIGAGGDTVVPLNGVPVGASAAAVRVTASGVTDNTYVSACPVALPLDACDNTSTLNPRNQDTSNLTIVPITAPTGNAIRLFNNRGSVTLQTDVVGWFVPSGSGSQYVAQAPERVQANDPLGARDSVTRSFAADIPAGATAVAANITTAGNTAVSYVSVCPGGSDRIACQRTSAVNPNPGQDTASSTLARLGGNRDLLYYNNAGNTLLFTDVQGYFLPRP